MPPDCLKRSRFDQKTPSRVGTIYDGRLVSTGKAGYVHFGPYVPILAGTYKLLVLGIGEVTSTASVDVVSSKGTIKHGKFNLTPTTNTQAGGILTEGLIELDEPVDDLEVRLHVGAKDKVTLQSYELVPVIGTNAPATDQNK